MPIFRLQLSHDADELVEFEVGGRPATVFRYSVVLRHLDPAGNATAVRVFDNSHDPREHHMHRCDAKDGEANLQNSSTKASRLTLLWRRVILSRTALKR
jgi:hypothetical protein